MKERNKAVPAVYLLLERDGKIVMQRRCNTGFRDGEYQPPAGHVEAGELPTEAAIREVKEEVGVVLRPEDLVFVHASYRPKHDETGERVDFVFKATTWEGEVANVEPEKCDDLIWVSPDAIPEKTIPHVRELIAAAYRGEVYSEIAMDYLAANGYVK